jgi:hypothetical protein
VGVRRERHGAYRMRVTAVYPKCQGRVGGARVQRRALRVCWVCRASGQHAGDEQDTSAPGIAAYSNTQCGSRSVRARMAVSIVDEGGGV